VGSLNATANLALTIGTFEIDTATATGTQAVTGVGFQPKHLKFYCVNPGTKEVSFGLAMTGAEYSVACDGTSGLWVNTVNKSLCDYENSNTTNYLGTIQTYDTDGFTISWVRTGSPTGFLEVYYEASR
jgi:hypothetical protein